MSAYVVENSTISKLLNFWQAQGFAGNRHPGIPLFAKQLAIGATREHITAMGQQMQDLNKRAVGERYPDGRIMTDCDPYEYESTMPPTPIAAFKALQCLLYQCSERTTDEQPLFKELSEYSRDLAQHIVANLPEYDACPWG